MSEDSLSPASPPRRQTVAVEPPGQTAWPGAEQQGGGRSMQALPARLRISPRRFRAATGGGSEVGMTDGRR
jgi:hypothetical protein